jgi:colanic acid biosynthesis glycosyl transferase WcaI
MPSVVFLNRFAWPDHAATGQLLSDLAEDLAAGGWQVTVLTGRARYDGGAPLSREERHAGVHYLRVGPAGQRRHGTAGRLAAYAGYLLAAAWRLARLSRPDVVVAMTDPPLLHAVALAVGALRGFATVWWVQDLYPELAVRLGMLRRGSVGHRLLAGVAASAARRCRRVVVLGPAMARAVVAAGARPDAVEVLHNGCDAGAVRPVAAECNPLRGELGLEGRFVVLYSGNLGRVHAFEGLIGAIRELRADEGIAFVFVGGGKRFPPVRAALGASGCRNVRFLDYFPRERLAQSLSLGDVSLVTEAPEAIGCVVPSKTYGVLASGRPVLFLGSPASDVAAIVREAGCGLTVAPGDAGAIAGAVRHLREHPQEVAALGARARAAAETLYDRPLAAARWNELLRGVLPPPRRVAARPAGALAPGGARGWRR